MLSFSVVIPTYDRLGQLQRCLEGLSTQNYPRDLIEVIVVDDGTPDVTAVEKLVRAWRPHLHLNVVTQPNAGPAAARNNGARHARHEYLAFIDDDCVPDPDWIRAMAEGFDAAPDDLIGGSTINALPHNPFSSASQELVGFLCAYFDGHDGRSRLFTSNNMALKRAHFQSLGGFDTGFLRAAGEDREFCDRWTAQGRPTKQVADAKSLHAHAMTLRAFWRQHFEYGRAAARFRRTRAARSGESVRVEPLSFYIDLLRAPFRGGVSWHAIESSILLALSQGANATGFLWSVLADGTHRASRDPVRGL